MDELRIEQLRGVLQAKESELLAYRYAGQILKAVEEAETRKADAVKAVNELKVKHAQERVAGEQAAAERQQHMADLEAHHQERVSKLQAQAEGLKAEIAEQRKSLDTWQAHLASIEGQHKDALSQWNQRIEQARGELSAVQAKIAAAEAKRKELAEMVR